MLFPNPVDQDGFFGPATLDNARNFLTKVWNLVRFAQAHLPDGTDAPDRAPLLTTDSPLENHWILARWHRTVDEFDQALATYDISRAAGLLHSFIWYDLADRYVEVSKEALAGRRGEPLRHETRAVLLFTLERTLRLLHPLVPHVTEELWHSIPHRGDLLARTAWPKSNEAPDDPEALVAMEVVYDAIRTLRSLRAENRLAPKSLPPAWVRPSGEETAEVLRVQKELVLQQARVGALDFLDVGAPPPAGSAPSVTAHGEFFLALPSERSQAERLTLERERDKLAGLLAKTEQRLADPGFRDRAPPKSSKRPGRRPGTWRNGSDGSKRTWPPRLPTEHHDEEGPSPQILRSNLGEAPEEGRPRRERSSPRGVPARKDGTDPPTPRIGPLGPRTLAAGR